MRRDALGNDQARAQHQVQPLPRLNKLRSFRRLVFGGRFRRLSMQLWMFVKLQPLCCKVTQGMVFGAVWLNRSVSLIFFLALWVVRYAACCSCLLFLPVVPRVGICATPSVPFARTSSYRCGCLRPFGRRPQNLRPLPLLAFGVLFLFPKFGMCLTCKRRTGNGRSLSFFLSLSLSLVLSLSLSLSLSIFPDNRESGFRAEQRSTLPPTVFCCSCCLCE